MRHLLLGLFLFLFLSVSGFASGTIKLRTPQAFKLGDCGTLLSSVSGWRACIQNEALYVEEITGSGWSYQGKVILYDNCNGNPPGPQCSRRSHWDNAWFTGVCTTGIKGQDSEGYYCEVPASCKSPFQDDGKGGCQCPAGQIQNGETCESKCAALEGGSFDLKGTILRGSPSLTLCRDNGDAKCSYEVTGGRFDSIINGGSGDYVYTAGSGKWTGESCSTANTTPADPTQPPPESTSPKGPQDCPANTTFAYVEGKGTCQTGKTPDNNTSDYCKSPDHQYEKTCGEGGEEFCKANPKTYACIPGSERYCTLKPASTSCQPGNADFCKANTDHASCQPGTKEYCATHPGDQACAVKQAEECANNPAIQNSDACKKAEQCAKYPNDPACKAPSGSTGGAQSDYCRQFPNDSKCVAGTFAGNCTTGFVCKGDAVQCAIAKELHRQGCAEAPTQDDYEMPGNWPDIVGKDGVEGSAIAGREEGIDLGQITMPDVSGVGSSCAVQDTSFSIDAIGGFNGGTVTIPTSLICTHGGAIRALLLFLSSLSCLWLIFTFGVKD